MIIPNRTIFVCINKVVVKMLPRTINPLKALFFQKAQFCFGETILAERQKREKDLARKLKKGLDATFLQVTDTTIGSNSCGEMFKILVESPQFLGKSKVQQHQMVAEVLKDDLPNIHGFNLKTKVPEELENPSKDRPETNE